jgi:hypothetical protein
LCHTKNLPLFSGRFRGFHYISGSVKVAISVQPAAVIAASVSV